MDGWMDERKWFELGSEGGAVRGNSKAKNPELLAGTRGR